MQNQGRDLPWEKKGESSAYFLFPTNPAEKRQRRQRLRLYQATPHLEPPTKKHRLTEGEKALEELKISLQKKKQRTPQDIQSTITFTPATPTRAEPAPPQASVAVAAREAESPANESQGVACLTMRELQYYALMQNGLNSPSVMLHTYNLRKLPHTFHIILRSHNGTASQYMGRCRVDECLSVTYKEQLLDKSITLPSDAERQYWISRIQEGKAVFAWRLQATHQTPAKPVRLTYQKYRHRHFYCPKEVLEAGVPRPPKRASLYETAPFFLRLLSSRDYRLLQTTAQALNGHKLRLGTTCSGSDIAVTAIKAVLRQLNREFNAAHLCIHVCTFLCEHLLLQEKHCQDHVLSVGSCQVVPLQMGYLAYATKTTVRYPLVCAMYSPAN